jgi:uncharacterized membrane protein YoaK (UPF0700 family)
VQMAALARKSAAVEYTYESERVFCLISGTTFYPKRFRRLSIHLELVQLLIHLGASFGHELVSYFAQRNFAYHAVNMAMAYTL